MTEERPGKFRRFLRSWGPVILAVLLIRAAIVESFRVPSGSMEPTIMPGDMLLVNKFIYGIPIPFHSGQIFDLRTPKPGDVVVFRYPVDPDFPEPESRYIRFFPKVLPLLPLYWDKSRNRFHWYAPRNFIKRCIAVAGDTVEVRNKRLYINNRLKDEPYVQHETPWTYQGLKLPKDRYQEEWQAGKFLDNPYIGGMVRDNFGPVVVPDNQIFVMGDNRDNSSDSRFWGPVPLKYIRGQALFLYFSISRDGIKWNRMGKLVR
jgi:signal peptidase I